MREPIRAEVQHYQPDKASRVMNMATATEVKERPILFSGQMVQAILKDHKRQTRRIIKPQPPDGYRSMVRECDPKGGWWFCNMPPQRGPFSVGEFSKWGHVYPRCPYGKPGDRLWVREKWRLGGNYYDTKLSDFRSPEEELFQHVHYAADDFDSELKGQYRPSIHMPRWASRITLELTGVRVERLHAIEDNSDDVRAEGIECPVAHHGACVGYCKGLREKFEETWKVINGTESWESDPWVWVIEFKRVPQ